MSKGKAPKTPDPYKVAQAQADANIRTGQTQTELNRYNEVNPYGSQTWATDPNNPNKYTLTTSYDPRVTSANNANLDRVNAVTKYANQLGNKNAGILDQTVNAPTAQHAIDLRNSVMSHLTDNAANVASSQATAKVGDTSLTGALNRMNDIAGQDFNFNNAPGMPTTDEATRKAISDAIYNRATGRLDPRFDREQQQLEARLAAQGITQGSGAYDTEQGYFGRNKNDAYTTAMQEAEIGSMDALNSQFANQLAARQQGVDEAQRIRDQVSKESQVIGGLSGQATSNLNDNLAAQRARADTVANVTNALMNSETMGFNNQQQQRQQAIDEYNALTGGTNNAGSVMPQFSGGAGGAGQIEQTPIAASVYNSYQGDMNRYGQKVGSFNNLLNGGASLGGMAMLAF